MFTSKILVLCLLLAVASAKLASPVNRELRKMKKKKKSASKSAKGKSAVNLVDTSAEAVALYFDGECPFLPPSQTAVLTCIAQGGVVTGYFGPTLSPTDIFGGCCPAAAFDVASIQAMATAGTIPPPVPYVFGDISATCAPGTNTAPNVGIVVGGFWWCLSM